MLRALFSIMRTMSPLRDGEFTKLRQEKKETLIGDLTTGPVAKVLIRFAVPMVLANLLQTIYNMVDMVVVGQFVGKVGLSSVAIGASLLQLMTFIAMGFCNAGQVIISQFVGAGDKKSVSRTIGTLFTIVLLSSLVFTVISSIGANTFLNLLNTPAEAFASAKAYCRVCFSGLFFIYGYNLVSAILRGMGDSRHPLMFIAIAAIINLILDLVFVAVFKLGAFGAALATVIGQAVSFISSIVLLYKRREAFNFDFKPESFKIDGAILRRLLKLGIPLCLQNIAISFSMLFVSSFINAYGVVASAVTGIGDKLGVISAVIASSLSTSGSAMIGQCLGAGKTDRVPRVIRFAMLVNLSFATILTLLTVLMPHRIFGLFNTDPDVLTMAMTYIPCAVLNYYGFALRSPVFSLINGVGHPSLNLTVGLLDGVICRIGLALLLGIVAGIGVKGFWYGNICAGYVPFIIGGTYYLSGRWKTRKILISR